MIRTETPVRHTKCGRMRGMVVGEGGRSSGVLLYIQNANVLNCWYLLACRYYNSVLLVFKNSLSSVVPVCLGV